jgi:hypothetical protein
VAGAHEEKPPTSKRDLTLVLSAVGAIFAGLIGTNVLDTGTTKHNLVWIDHAAVTLWLPALFLLALCAYKSPTESAWMREGAWVATVLAGRSPGSWCYSRASVSRATETTSGSN